MTNTNYISRTETQESHHTSQASIEDACKCMLNNLGENIEREGLLDTPKRYAKAMMYLTQGYKADLNEVINGALFSSSSTGVVVVKDIDFFSMCEHHILPFHGKVHIAYIPSGKVLGLSKFARVVEVFARRLQIQEQLNEQIADAIEDILEPKGVIVSIEAAHMCMSMRGVQKIGSKTLTTVARGELKDDQKCNETLFKFFNSSVS
ncbi:GTP cyclohydrolase I FolE [Gynuella sp.]|uniref:GTP cyclohydrolase I FolE n=1 Tax=Gynuella sp. TaxID=2969146 RepID=UPI003D0F7D3A